MQIVLAIPAHPVCAAAPRSERSDETIDEDAPIPLTGDARLQAFRLLRGLFPGIALPPDLLGSCCLAYVLESAAARASLDAETWSLQERSFVRPMGQIPQLQQCRARPGPPFPRQVRSHGECE